MIERLRKNSQMNIPINFLQVVEESLSDEDLPADVRDSMERWGELSCLNVPLVYDCEPVGILVLNSTTRERHFGPQETELAKGLGEQAAVAIRHAQLYRRQERGNKRLLALLETSRVLAWVDVFAQDGL